MQSYSLVASNDRQETANHIVNLIMFFFFRYLFSNISDHIKYVCKESLRLFVSLIFQCSKGCKGGNHRYNDCLFQLATTTFLEGKKISFLVFLSTLNCHLKKVVSVAQDFTCPPQETGVVFMSFNMLGGENFLG